MTEHHFGPRGWHAGQIERRYLDATSAGPISFNEAGRSVDCVISRGSPVRRFYGTEILRIDSNAVIIDRLIAGGIPLLDSHSQASITNALGRVVEVWFGGDALMGRLKFNETPQGEMAMGMVERNEVAGISAGYKVEEWEIADGDGRVIDPEVDRVRWDDDALTFTATRWELLEASLVTVAADADAYIRSLGMSQVTGITDIRARMSSRERMSVRQAMHDNAQAVMGDGDA
jgi:hypothetical protein